MVQVVTLGETLIDFIPVKVEGQPNCFQANPGGAPSNFLTQLTRLGHSTAVIAAVGQDGFGDLLVSTLEAEGVDVSSMQRPKSVPTTLAFVYLNEDNERSFSFYRDPGADLMVTFGEKEKVLIDSAQLFHCGTLSLVADPARQATLEALQYAKEAGKKISADINLRFNLWDSEDRLKEAVDLVLQYCQILKISDDELAFFTGTEDLEAGVSKLFSLYPLELIALTKGSQGSSAFTRTQSSHVAGIEVQVADTTGCGDSFFGAFVGAYLDSNKEFDALTSEDLLSFLEFAGATGSLAATKKGGIPSLPTRQEVESFMESLKQ